MISFLTAFVIFLFLGFFHESLLKICFRGLGRYKIKKTKSWSDNLKFREQLKQNALRRKQHESKVKKKI